MIKMKNLAIITARSGSKGLPDKNILPLCGKPLMWYSIKAALDSGMYDEVMVSTDSEKYAQIARECGANVPFFRSEETSGDYASTYDCIKEILNDCRAIGEEFDTFTILQPTSPLRTSTDIVNAFKLKSDRNAKYVLGVTEAEHPIGWHFSINEDLTLDKYVIDNKAKNRQSAQKYYRPNGAVYIMNSELMDKYENFLPNPDTVFFVMDGISSIDIDSEVDFVLAEYFFKKRENEK